MQVTQLVNVRVEMGTTFSVVEVAREEGGLWSAEGPKELGAAWW